MFNLFALVLLSMPCSFQIYCFIFLFKYWKKKRNGNFWWAKRIDTITRNPCPLFFTLSCVLNDLLRISVLRTVKFFINRFARYIMHYSIQIQVSWLYAFFSSHLSAPIFFSRILSRPGRTSFATWFDEFHTLKNISKVKKKKKIRIDTHVS